MEDEVHTMCARSLFRCRLLMTEGFFVLLFCVETLGPWSASTAQIKVLHTFGLNYAAGFAVQASCR